MKCILLNQKGSALLIALCLTMMLALIGIMAVKNSDTDIDLSFYQTHSEKAFYIAEAGAKRACVELMKDRTWDSSFSSIVFGNGAYDVQLTDSSDDAALGDTIIITSRGWTPEATAVVEMVMIPELIYPWRHALFADKRLDLKNSMTTDSYNSDSGSYFATHEDAFGDVGSNGVLWTANGAYIGGDASVTDPANDSVNVGTTVTGSKFTDAPENDLAPIPQAQFDAAAASNDNSTGLGGTYSYNSTTKAFVSDGDVVLASGTYYFSSFILKNAASLTLEPGAQVKIYVTGDIEIKNSGDVNTTGAPGDLMFLGQGNLVLKNSGSCTGVFYAPDGDGDLRNSSDFYGSIATSTATVHNAANFHYDRNLGDISVGESDRMELAAWREL